MQALIINPITLLSDRPDAVAQLEAYDRQHAPLCDCEMFCFEEDYQAIAQSLQDRGITPSTITDIGCSFGAQSLYFPEWQYIGVDRHQAQGCTGSITTDEIIDIPFFREGEAGVKYVLATFPDLDSEWCGDVFIANMSVGYPMYSITETDLLTAFEQFTCGYFKGPAAILETLKQVFSHCEVAKDCRFMAPDGNRRNILKAPHIEHDFSVYFLSRES